MAGSSAAGALVAATFGGATMATARAWAAWALQSLQGARHRREVARHRREVARHKRLLDGTPFAGRGYEAAGEEMTAAQREQLADIPDVSVWRPGSGPQPGGRHHCDRGGPPW